MSEGMSKRELKQLRRLEKLEKAKLEHSQNKNKTLIFAIAGFLFVAFFAAIIVFTKESKKVDSPTSQNGDVPINFTLDGAIKGPENAPITLVEFGDYQCPACGAYHPIVNEVLQKYPSDVKLLFKHFPISSIHPFALDAALAAEAAGQQGKYYEMHNLLYERQDEWTKDPKAKFEEYAKEIGLDIDKFNEDIDRSDLKQKIDGQRVEGIDAGVNSTPSFFINGKKIVNPQNADGFASLIDEALANGNNNPPTDSEDESGEKTDIEDDPADSNAPQAQKDDTVDAVGDPPFNE